MLDDLRKAVDRYTEAQLGQSPYATAVDGLIMLRSRHEKHPDHLLFRPSLCIVLQGAKWAIFGGQRLDYRAGQALVVSVEMPAFGRVAEASPEAPYLGLIIEFDLAIMREVLQQIDVPPAEPGSVGQGVFVSDFDGPMADCALRLVRLLERPSAIPVLYPSIMRELSYWLLSGPRGGEIAQVALGANHAEPLIRAIHVLRDRFAKTVRIEELAAIAGMSTSSFHRQFKSLTLMTPLQYQKQMRLLEARRLMVAEAANAETAAYEVGYESASQFSREYTRMFGAPPRRDIAELKTTLAA